MSHAVMGAGGQGEKLLVRFIVSLPSPMDVGPASTKRPPPQDLREQCWGQRKGGHRTRAGVEPNILLLRKMEPSPHTKNHGCWVGAELRAPLKKILPNTKEPHDLTD
ncbi:graves disease carrier protein [Platysternon megacephalum]|uniref:Graves disease carrier protein n=1 Tax=Platysternon megacephalum TaxID=55544 RepID=A0A4D9EP63_9SAUR|nr:graves disease carrier protein [Platysternon megacephalum]